MAESEDRKVFKEGFATLTAQLKQNRADERQAEIDKAIQDRKDAQDAIDKAKELQKTQEDAVKAAEEAASKTLEQLKKQHYLNGEMKEETKNLLKEQKESVKIAQAAVKEAEKSTAAAEQSLANSDEAEKRQIESTNAILKLQNQSREDAQSNKDQLTSINDMKEIQRQHKEEIESQGGVAEDSKFFQKTNLDIAQKELNLRKQAAKRDGISKAGQEEIDKEQKRINSERGTVFGKMSNYMMDMRDTLKKGMTATGKGVLFGAAFLAIGAFLQSEYFSKTIDYIFDTLIPKLKEFYDAFFGPEGGFINGVKKLFGDDSGIGKIVAGILVAVGLFVAFKFVGLLKGIGSLLSAVTGFGGKKGLGRFLGKGGMLKGAVTAFAGLGASLKGFMGGITGFASKGLDMVKNAGAKLMDSAKNMAKGALDLAKKGVTSLKDGAKTVASKVVGGAKAVGTGLADTAKAMGSDVKSGAGKATKAIKGTGKNLAASAAKAFKAFPRLGLAAKLVPGLGAALAAGQGIAILMDDSMSKDDKIKAFGGLLGGTLGSAGFAALGAALGTAVFPGVGTIGGGLLGGVLGYFGGDYAGRKAASFLLGEQTEEEKLGSTFSDDASASGSAPNTLEDFGGAGSKVYDSKSMRQNADGTTTTLANFETHKDRQVRLRKEKSAKKQLRVEERLAMEDFGESGQISPLNQSAGGGQPIVVNAPSTTNAPVNNNSTTSSNNVIVEADPMFNRVSRYAI